MKLDRAALELSLVVETGIARAVKSLSSEHDEVGSLARKLVSKWKNQLKQYRDQNQSARSSATTVVVEKTPIKEHSSKKSIMNKPGSHEPIQSQAAKPVKRPPSPSLDSSSGLSFEAALGLSAAPKKKPKRSKVSQSANSQNGEACNDPKPLPPNPSQSFTEEILKSLADPFERPDVQPTPKQPGSSVLFYYCIYFLCLLKMV